MTFPPDPDGNSVMPPPPSSSLLDSDNNNDDDTVSLLDLAAASLAAAIVAADQITALARQQPSPNGDNNSNNNNGNDLKNVRLKADGSVVTDADLAAQHIIVDALRRVSQGVRIVGEESEDDMKGHGITGHEKQSAAMYRLARKEVRIRYRQQRLQSTATAAAGAAAVEQQMPLSQGIAINDDESEDHYDLEEEEDVDEQQHSFPTAVQETKEDKLLLSERIDVYKVDPSRVSVFIDPLDGTKAYAKGDYDPVSILIAIILDQTPCFGVICKPFGYRGQTSILDTGCVAIYGGTLLGAAYTAGGTACSLPIAQRPTPADHTDDPTMISSSSDGSDTLSAESPLSGSPSQDQLPRAVISGSRSKGVVQNFVTHLGDKGMINPQPLLISGAGEKSLRIILRSENEGLWFFPKAGTSLWDVAASDALLRATGGRLTDKNGHDMDYSKSRTEAENEDGVVACYDQRLHAECIKLFLEGTWDESSS